jgi:di/tricarboxylate transporter
MPLGFIPVGDRSPLTYFLELKATVSNCDKSRAELPMQPLTPDAHGIAVLLLIATALFLFSRDRLPLETSSLAILIVLVTGFHLFPYESATVPLGTAQFLSGFGNEALITICALIMVGKALETTGALQPLASVVSLIWKTRPALAMLLTLVAVAVLSAFINDTPIVVLMIPILIGISLQAKFPVSGIMLPMGFATIIGGMSTTIGTSTNLLVVGVAENLGLERFGMFDFVLPVAMVGSVGLLYLWLLAPRLLPDRVLPMADTTPRIFNGQLFVNKDSFAAGKTLSAVLARMHGEMRVTRIQRGESLFLAKLPSTVLRPGDRLIVRDTPDNLKRFEGLLGATLFNVSDSENPIDERTPLKEAGQQLAEVVVTRDSPLHLRSLAAMRFSARYRLLPLAIHRAGAPSSEVEGDLHSIKLRAGDVLLIQGRRDAINELKNSSNMLVLDGTTDLPAAHRAKRALAVMALVIVTAAVGLMPISVSALIGLGLMLGLGCVTWRDATQALPMPVIMIVVTSLALGKALVGTGMAVYLATGFVSVASDLPAAMILSMFLLILAILTNIVSNNAAAVIGTPIAIATAQQLNVDPTPFVLAVIFGANMSFATPFGYQTNLLILSAGGYRFSDFIRVGIPLAIIMWLGYSIVLPLLYDL